MYVAAQDMWLKVSRPARQGSGNFRTGRPDGNAGTSMGLAISI